jgi:hypothetical protein
MALREVSSKHPGDTEVVLVLGEESSRTALRMPFKVAATDELTSALHEFFEQSCVVLKSS